MMFNLHLRILFHLGLKTIHNYKSTQTFNDVTYFQCINRKKGQTTSKKCLAKVHYFSKTNTISVINLHNPNCKENSDVKIKVNLDYQSQKQEIRKVLSENPNLGVSKTMDFLRKKNMAATPKTKKVLSIIHKSRK